MRAAVASGAGAMARVVARAVTRVVARAAAAAEGCSKGLAARAATARAALMGPPLDHGDALYYITLDSRGAREKQRSENCSVKS